MLRLISHLFNAAAFLSVAGLAWNVGAERFGHGEARNNLATLVRQLAGGNANAEAPAALAAGREAGAPSGTTKVGDKPAHYGVLAQPEPTAKTTAKDAELPALASSGLTKSVTLPFLAPLTNAGTQGTVSAPAREPQAATGSLDRAEAKPEPVASKPGPVTSETTKAVDAARLQPPVAAGPASQPRADRKPVGDVIVPPIRRQKPSVQAIVSTDKKSVNGKGAQAATKGVKSAAKGTSARSANSPADAAKKRNDAAGRSSLGAAANAATASDGRGGCNQGLRFDARISRCVPLPSPTAATPLQVRITP